MEILELTRNTVLLCANGKACFSVARICAGIKPRRQELDIISSLLISIMSTELIWILIFPATCDIEIVSCGITLDWYNALVLF